MDGLMPITESEVKFKQFYYTSIYRSKAFTEAMNNYFDIKDDKTRNILLAVNEADQNTVMVSLANRLYGHIVEKVDDIDFGTIPESKGDITKIENYDKLVDCVNIITEILQEYRQDITPIATVNTAIQNMIDRTDMFTMAYRIGTEMPIIIYNTITLAIVSSVSYMISSCIEFIKSSDTEGFDIAINKTGVVKTKDCLLFDDLKKFNKLCASGEFDKAMDFVIKQNAKNFSGLYMYGIGGAAMIFGIILLIIPVIRELIFFFYYSRTKVADYFEAQATLLTMNAYNIENNLTKDVKNKKEVVKKQKKIADMFNKLANKISFENKSGSAKAKKDIEKLNKEKYKIDDVTDSIPDSANSVLF